LPAPTFYESLLGPDATAEPPTVRSGISFFEAVMLGVVGGAVGGGVLGGLNASGAVDTVLTVEFGAVFGILVGVVSAGLLALAIRFLRRAGNGVPDQAEEPELAPLRRTRGRHRVEVSMSDAGVPRSRLTSHLDVLEPAARSKTAS
jgi:hypothetical protein